jgi:hypothetical protein
VARDIKVVNFTPKAESEENKQRREQMASMLEEVLKGVKEGTITGYVFVARKRPGTPSGADDAAFEYILANALDVGLIGEIQVINNRLIAYYDQASDTGDEAGGDDK